MNNIIDNDSDNNQEQLVSRYETMIAQNSTLYFDVFEIESLIDFYIQKDMIKIGLQVCELGLELHQNSFDLLQKKAQLFIELNLPSQSLRILRKLSVIEPNNIETLILKGIAQSKLGNIRKSLEYFDRILLEISDEKSRLIVLSEISITYIGIGRYDIAVKYLREAHKLVLNDYDIILDLAFCLERTNEIEEAIVLYKRYLDEKPFSSLAWYNLGICYEKQEDKKESLSAYNFALALDNEFASAQINKASLLHDMAKYEEAIESFYEFLLLEPENEDAYFLIGKSYFEIENYNIAIKCYNSVLKINPKHSEALYNIGLVYMIKGRYKKSNVFINKAIETNNENATYWFTLAKNYLFLKEYKKSEKAYLETINIEPFVKEIWIDYFEFKFNQNAYNEAIDILIKAIEYTSENASINSRLAATCFLNGSESEAYKYLGKALSENKNSEKDFLKYYPQGKKDSKISKFIIDCNL